MGGRPLEEEGGKGGDGHKPDQASGSDHRDLKRLKDNLVLIITIITIIWF